jgi:hypothetical protein
MMNPMHKLKDVFFDYTEFVRDKTHPCIFLSGIRERLVPSKSTCASDIQRPSGKTIPFLPVQHEKNKVPGQVSENLLANCMFLAHSRKPHLFNTQPEIIVFAPVLLMLPRGACCFL